MILPCYFLIQFRFVWLSVTSPPPVAHVFSSSPRPRNFLTTTLRRASSKPSRALQRVSPRDARRTPASAIFPSSSRRSSCLAPSVSNAADTGVVVRPTFERLFRLPGALPRTFDFEGVAGDDIADHLVRVLYDDRVRTLEKERALELMGDEKDRLCGTPADETSRFSSGLTTSSTFRGRRIPPGA